MSEETGRETAASATVGRRQLMKLWQVFLAAFAAHVVFVFLFSPGIFSKEDTSPEGLLKKARELVGKQQFEAALEIYQQIQLQRPQIPAVFEDADKEIREVRLKALEAERKAAEAAKAAEESKPKGPEKTGEGGKGGTGPTPPTDTGPKPPVDLPSLPDIGGEDL